MVNHTPEYRLWAPVPAVVVPKPCGWCSSTHVSDNACTCETDCTVGWCAKAADLQEVRYL